MEGQTRLPGGAHTHPCQEERVEVVSGTLGIRVGRRRYVVRPGETAIVPPGVDPLVEFQPALDTESLFGSLYGLAHDGRTPEKGIPHPLQMVTLLDEYADELRLPLLPTRTQRALVSALAPLAARKCYSGRYSAGTAGSTP